MLTRRRFIALGLTGGLATVLIGLPLVRTPETKLLDALSDALFTDALSSPDTGPLPSELDAGQHAWAYARQLPVLAQWQLRGALRLLEYSALAAGGRFSHLPLERRQQMLQSWASSPWLTPRLIVTSLKQICAIGTYRHPRMWASIGYDGPLLPTQEHR